jgi:hypothetical protein
MTKKAASDRFGMTSTLAMNADARAEAYKGARGGDEEGENLSRSTRAIEKIFQA